LVTKYKALARSKHRSALSRVRHPVNFVEGEGAAGLTAAITHVWTQLAGKCSKWLELGGEWNIVGRSSLAAVVSGGDSE